MPKALFNRLRMFTFFVLQVLELYYTACHKYDPNNPNKRMAA